MQVAHCVNFHYPTGNMNVEVYTWFSFSAELFNLIAADYLNSPENAQHLEDTVILNDRDKRGSCCLMGSWNYCQIICALSVTSLDLNRSISTSHVSALNKTNVLNIKNKKLIVYIRLLINHVQLCGWYFVNAVISLLLIPRKMGFSSLSLSLIICT